MGRSVLVLLVLAAQPMLRCQPFTGRVVESGVELYEKPGLVPSQPTFWEVFKSLFKAWNPPASIPFRRTVAFLVGVSDYKNLKKLPGVDNDLNRVRDFLLNRSGFDQVYVARGAAATPAVVQHYMMDFFHSSANLGIDDRLLFYYTGHGDDAGGNNPYLQFAGAMPGSFGDNSVLAVDSYEKWSSRIMAKHALFIFDACLAGEVLTPQGNEEAERAAGLLATLSGKGSRTLVTAGTFGQSAWYAEEQAGGHSVFTEDLLTVMEDPQGPALMSIDEVIGKTERLAADFARRKGVPPAIPQVREFDSRNSPGRFVFLNTQSEDPKLPTSVVAAMGLKSKGPESGARLPPEGTGMIEVYSPRDGTLDLNGKQIGTIQLAETRRLLQIAVGPHRIRIKGTNGEDSADVTVLAGVTAYPAFNSPIDDTGKRLVGRLNVKALAGDFYVDNFKVGHLEEDGTLAVPNVIAGLHQCRSVSPTQESTSTCNVVANKATDIDLRPLPPTNLTVTVH
jgi:uncharacterized caspase-like protein